MSKINSRQSLSIDIDSLFPGDHLDIGGQSIYIKPLGLEQIIILTNRVKRLGTTLAKEGVTWENYNTHENLFKLVSILITNAPDVLEEAANLDIKDIKRLPLEVVVQLASKIIEVNLQSKDTLEKNFKSLTEQFSQKKTVKTKKD